MYTTSTGLIQSGWGQGSSRGVSRNHVVEPRVLPVFRVENRRLSHQTTCHTLNPLPIIFGLNSGAERPPRHCVPS